MSDHRPMESPNLELVRSIYTTWEGGDFSSSEWAHEDIEYIGADGPPGGRFAGRQAMAEVFGDFLSAWEGWRVKAEEYRELDANRVLVLFHFSARGKRSGLEVGQIWTKGATLFRLRDGKVASLTQYLDRELAFAELSL
jgi:ketosteroid isomerase-like protein